MAVGTAIEAEPNTVGTAIQAGPDSRDCHILEVCRQECWRASLGMSWARETPLPCPTQEPLRSDNLPVHAATARTLGLAQTEALHEPADSLSL